MTNKFKPIKDDSFWEDCIKKKESASSFILSSKQNKTETSKINLLIEKSPLISGILKEQLLNEKNKKIFGIKALHNLTQLYIKGVEEKEIKNKNNEKLKNENELKEIKKCTFKPKININSTYEKLSISTSNRDNFTSKKNNNKSNEKIEKNKNQKNIRTKELKLFDINKKIYNNDNLSESEGCDHFPEISNVNVKKIFRNKNKLKEQNNYSMKNESFELYLYRYGKARDEKKELNNFCKRKLNSESNQVGFKSLNKIKKIISNKEMTDIKINLRNDLLDPNFFDEEED